MKDKKTNGKMRGFRRDLILTQARTMKRHGTKLYGIFIFLTQHGFNRRMANRIAERMVVR